ncbi:nitrite reductase (NAD(P)H) large subunit [Methylophaga lonarensis MPL]|uniref:Nitrite reductase (NAD(P)H) large subunit n=1 Tax=Methylophaga lonarensis MPL TaxID=1286106 RepID=M7NYP6_9GAMM|nr:nitrite reductase large subunit NirB [Methylophaga lonarensis]EMR12357.1 nitrite reductase (NAD(P)H) large subunit [Methylophaga lonarensis MPL]
MKEKLVLIGNGMAGVRTLEEVLKLSPDKYEITVFGDEPYGNYNRIMLSPVLAGEKTINQIMINDLQWYQDNNITLHAGKRITKIDRVNCQVISEDGTVADYDRLLMATGSRPFILPIPGSDLPGVISFRDIADVDFMLETAQTHKKAVVIGGGLLGLEAANGLMIQGMDVTVVHLTDVLMNQQLDKPASDMMLEQLQAKGLKFLMQHESAAIEGDGRVERLLFKDGSSIDTDLVVMAVGIRPNAELAKSAGIYCERGIVVDDTMQTYDPKIYAVGECVQHRGLTFGLVAPLFEQAKVCANHLVHMGIARYMSSITSTKLKVTGIDLFSAGDFIGDESTEDLVFKDAARHVYKKLVIKNDQLVGAVLYGDTVDGAWYFQLMRDGTDVSSLREFMLFGQHHLGDSGHGAANAVDGLPDDAEICGCNGVCKGDIVKAITTESLFTLDEVKAHTKAAASCGSCTGLVEQLLASTLGSDFNDTPTKKAMCGCTDMSHGEVKAAIREQQLKSIPEVMQALDWKTSDGCHSCRPALNYYLLSTWPNEYVDDAQSRFINERVHANIQKDGTYSVVPRMWGGVTNARELRALADISDKYNVPTVKVTGGQRIDLLGVKKEDLPNMWADLSEAGFVSGHAYGKSLRTVKTCVGSEWCRFGTQDSTGLGINIEKMTWGSWTPHKFKIAVSGCPRNCAEATIKDLGVVCVDSGYELHVGGNGGIKVRATDFLCKVSTEEEVMEYTAAFMQLYREDAHYLERTAPWIERVGLKSVVSQLVDDPDNRKLLAERFYESQKNAQEDPWAQHAATQRENYIPIKQVG